MTITLRLPADCPLGVPVGRWHREPDGAVVAEWKREELEEAMYWLGWDGSGWVDGKPDAKIVKEKK